MAYTHKPLIAIAVTAISLLVAVIIAEFTARYFLRDITTTSVGSSYFLHRWKDAYATQVNSFGFREREIDPGRNDKVFRIALVGDSFTYGMGIDVESRLSNQLERILNSGSSAYEVLNFGKGGAETVDHVKFLKNHVIGIQPDFVLLQWFVNDVEGGNYEGRPEGLRLIPSDTLSGILDRHSVLYFLVNSQWQAIQPGLGLGSNFTYNEYMVDRFREPEDESAAAARKALDQFIESSRQHDIPVGILVYPELTGSYLKGYRLGFLLDRVLETCSKWEIKCIDMRKVFEGIDPPAKLWANRFDSHPGTFANALAAVAILETFRPVWNEMLAGD